MMNLFTPGFAKRQPEMALVSRTPIPSGAPKIVLLRDKLLNLSGSLLEQLVRSGPATCRHSTEVAAAWLAGTIYSGSGRLDVQRRPSPYSNPFLQLSPKAALYAFSTFLFSRADMENCLRLF